MPKVKTTKKRDPKTSSKAVVFKKKISTRSTTAPDRKKAIDEEKARAILAAAALQKKRDDALAAQPKAAPGNRNDGSFHLAFVQMGQGDCAIMSSPQGKTIMIDCGSDATEEVSEAIYRSRIKSVVYGPKFLKDSVDLDYLIFTHPDSDHYNNLKYILEDTTKIHNVYHSSALINYAVAQTSAWVHGHVGDPSFIKAVTLNESGAFINGAAAVPDARKTLRIVEEKDGFGKVVFAVSILCSNVSVDSQADSSNDTNRGSVVTLIEAFDKKIVICGDATRSTEKFALDRYNTLDTAGTNPLVGIVIAQAPHHGSANTSSSPAWVAKLAPEVAIASAGKLVYKDHLPSEAALNRYLALQVDNKVASHEIFYWSVGAMGSYNDESAFTKKALYITGSNGTQTIDGTAGGLNVGV